MLIEKVFVLVLIGILALTTLTAGVTVYDKAQELENSRTSIEMMLEMTGGN